MPELPEVETLRRMLARTVRGRAINEAVSSGAALRQKRMADFAASARGRHITGFSRRGKYLIIELDGPNAILVHLGMSGTLIRRDGRPDGDALDPRHDHLRLRLDDGSWLVYNDPRRFGTVRLVPAERLEQIPELAKLGPEPLGAGFDAAYLARVARGRRVAIKNLLMDQQVVAGIGNIYAAEILFRAGVRPTRRSGRLGRNQLERVAEASREVLREAIGSGGTTIRNYRDARGRAGNFRLRLKVYGREGELCVACGTPIRSVRLGQRASFFCPRCQR